MDKKGVALIIVILIMVILALLGTYLSNLQSIYLETSPLYYYKATRGFLGDAGLERAKQIMEDAATAADPFFWRPWAGWYTNGAPKTNRGYCGVNSSDPICQRSVCPDGCSNNQFPNYDPNCDYCYLEEHITIPPQGKEGYYKIWVTGPRNSPTVTVESYLGGLKVTNP